MSKLDIRIEPATQSAPVVLPDPLGFGRHFTARMFTQHYTAGRGCADWLILSQTARQTTVVVAYATTVRKPI